jgi:hypothetical protein
VLPVAGQTQVDASWEDIGISGEDLAIKLFRPGVIMLAGRGLRLMKQFLKGRALTARAAGAYQS